MSAWWIYGPRLVLRRNTLLFWFVLSLQGKREFGVGSITSALSVAGLLGPILFGYLDPGGRARRYYIVGCTFGFALLFVILALNSSAVGDVILLLLSGFLSGYIVLQYDGCPRGLFGRSDGARASSIYHGDVPGCRRHANGHRPCRTVRPPYSE
jgi:hypothetical protein